MTQRHNYRARSMPSCAREALGLRSTVVQLTATQQRHQVHRPKFELTFD